MKDFKKTIRFVILIATPLCLVNSFIFSYESNNIFEEWTKRFLTFFSLSFPQAVIYVSLIKLYDRRKMNKANK